jgi:small membrane protein
MEIYGYPNHCYWSSYSEWYASLVFDFFSMNLLQIFFIISGLIIFLVALDIAKRERFNALHFLVFLGVGSGLLVFTVFPNSLNLLGQLFGLQRGADLLVYASIIFLFYFVLLLLRKVENTREEVTRLIREIALSNAKK